MPLAIDELPLVALLGCFAEGETVVRGARGAARSRSPTGSRPWSTDCAGSGADIEALEDGSPCAAPAALRGGRIDAHGDHRLALLGAVAGLASEEGVEVVGMEAAEVSYPGFARDIAPGCRLMVVAIDGPAGAGKSTVARAVAAELGFTYLDSGAMYRCVALAALERGVEPAAVAAELRIELGERVRLDGRDVTEEIRTPAVSEAASRAAADPAVRRRWWRSSAGCWPSGDWVAEGRDIGTVVAPEAEVKVFLTASPEERARRRADGARRRPGHRAGRAGDPRPARHRPASTRRWRPAPDAVVLDTTGLTLADVVERSSGWSRRRGLRRRRRPAALRKFSWRAAF